MMDSSGASEVESIDSDNCMAFTDDDMYSDYSTSMTESDEVDDDRSALLQVDLTDLKARRYQLKNFPSLQDLSLDCIHSNLDFFSTKVNQFHLLPGSLLEMLLRFMEAIGESPNCPHLLPMFITDKSCYLQIQFCNYFLKRVCKKICTWDQESMIRILQLIRQKSQDRLRSLLLKFPSTYDVQGRRDEGNSELQSALLAELNTTLASLQGLVKLTLHNCNVTDETLAIIVNTCKNLSELEIPYNKEDAVSDSGLKLLATGECKDTLTKLAIHGLNQVSENALVFLLCNLPQLKILKHIKTGVAVVKYIEQNPNNELKIEQVDFGFGDSLNNQNICTTLKNVKLLHINGNEKLTMFHNLLGVEELHIQAMSYTFQDISSLLINYSSKLTTLYLYNSISSDFDVSYIGYHCKQLQAFTWHTNWNPRINCKYKLTQEHFSELRMFNIYCSNIHVSYFPPMVLEQMLASPKLENLIITNLEIPEDILLSLIENARIYSVIFSNLTSINLERVEASVSCLKEVVALAPKLRYLCIRNLRDRERNLYKFVKEHKLQIQLD